MNHENGFQEFSKREKFLKPISRFTMKKKEEFLHSLQIEKHVSREIAILEQFTFAVILKSSSNHKMYSVHVINLVLVVSGKF